MCMCVLAHSQCTHIHMCIHMCAHTHTRTCTHKNSFAHAVSLWTWSLCPQPFWELAWSRSRTAQLCLPRGRTCTWADAGAGRPAVQVCQVCAGQRRAAVQSQGGLLTPSLSPAAMLDEDEDDRVDEAALRQLTEMGFPESRACKALRLNQYVGVSLHSRTWSWVVFCPPDSGPVISGRVCP